MVFWLVLFTCLLVISVTANLVVVWIVVGHSSMRTVPNYFLASLAVADLSMCVFNCAPNFTYIIAKTWHLGSLFCTFTNFMSYYTVALSVGLLMALTAERYLVVMKPLQGRLRHSSPIISLVIITILSTVLCLPPMLFSTTKELSGGTVVCFLQWPDGNPSVSIADTIYNFLFLGLTYVIPMAIMGFCYTVIGHELWGGGDLMLGMKDNMSRQPAITRAVEKKRKIVKMSLIVVILFMVCWLPYHVYFILVFFVPDIGNLPWIEDVYLGIYLMAMSTTLVNPMVYYFINTKFRRYFQNIFSCGFYKTNPIPQFSQKTCVVYQSHGEDANNCSLYMFCSTSNKVGTKVKVMDRRSSDSLGKTQSCEVVISGKYENRYNL